MIKFSEIKWLNPSHMIKPKYEVSVFLGNDGIGSIYWEHEYDKNVMGIVENMSIPFHKGENVLRQGFYQLKERGTISNKIKDIDIPFITTT